MLAPERPGPAFTRATIAEAGIYVMHVCRRHTDNSSHGDDEGQPREQEPEQRSNTRASYSIACLRQLPGVEVETEPAVNPFAPPRGPASRGRTLPAARTGQRVLLLGGRDPALGGTSARHG